MRNTKLNPVKEFSNKPDLYILTVHADNLLVHYTESEINYSLQSLVKDANSTKVIQAMRGWGSFFSKETLIQFYKIRVDKELVA